MPLAFWARFPNALKSRPQFPLTSPPCHNSTRTSTRRRRCNSKSISPPSTPPCRPLWVVNYFNRFGRQWQTYVEAEGSSRANIANINQFYVRSANGSQVQPDLLIGHVRRVLLPGPPTMI